MAERLLEDNQVKFSHKLATICICFFASMAGAQSAQEHAGEPLQTGQVLRNPAAYEYDDGSDIDLNKFRGKPILIYRGADWCAPCFKARPSVLELAKKHKAQGLTVILLMSDPEKRREANRQLAQNEGVLFGMSKREACKTADCSYGIKGGPWNVKGVVPSAWLVDKDGILVKAFPGSEAVMFDMKAEVQKLFP
jgi:thiol-disulfide isomerase/thioredoxin